MKVVLCLLFSAVLVSSRSNHRDRRDLPEVVEFVPLPHEEQQQTESSQDEVQPQEIVTTKVKKIKEPNGPIIIIQRNPRPSFFPFFSLRPWFYNNPFNSFFEPDDDDQSRVPETSVVNNNREPEVDNVGNHLKDLLNILRSPLFPLTRPSIPNFDDEKDTEIDFKKLPDVYNDTKVYNKTDKFGNTFNVRESLQKNKTNSTSTILHWKIVNLVSPQKRKNETEDSAINSEQSDPTNNEVLNEEP